jgi:hypothetical protein
VGRRKENNEKYEKENERVMKPTWSTIYLQFIELNLLSVSGLLVAHRQEVAMYICDSWYVLYVLVYCRRARCLLLMGY